MKQSLLNEIRKRNLKADLNLVSKAYDFSFEAHRHQKRKGNEDLLYFSHVYAVVKHMIEYESSTAGICAALLHDTVEDTDVSLDDIRKNFNKEIALLVDGCTKINIIEDRQLSKKKTHEKILALGKKDRRIFMIKVFDRFHNSFTGHKLEEHRQGLFAEESIDFYIPLAEELGLEKVAGIIRKNTDKLIKEIEARKKTL